MEDAGRNDSTIDAVTGVGILAIILGHTKIVDASTTLHIQELVYAFHVPLFFLVSGFFMNGSWGGLKKSVSRILVPFLLATVFWALVAPILLKLPMFFRSSTVYPIKYDFGAQLLVLFDSLLRCSKEKSLGTGLWLLATLFVARIFWVLIFGVLKAPKHYLVIAACVVSGMALHYFRERFTPSSVPWMLHLGFIAFTFMAVGHLLLRSRALLSSDAELLLLGPLGYLLIPWNGRTDFQDFSFNTVSLYYLTAILIFVGVFSACRLAVAHTVHARRFLVWCGENSLMLLLLHPFFIIICPYVANSNFEMSVSDATYGFTSVAIAWALTFLSAWGISKIGRTPSLGGADAGEPKPDVT